MDSATAAANDRARGTFMTENPDRCKVFEIAVNDNLVERQAVEVEKPAGVWQPWLCYALGCQLTYHPRANAYDYGGQRAVVFYPFQRMFFTAFEASLDKTLLNIVHCKKQGVAITAEAAVEIQEEPPEGEFAEAI
jgi:hypothetical protein